MGQVLLYGFAAIGVGTCGAFVIVLALVCLVNGEDRDQRALIWPDAARSRP